MHFVMHWIKFNAFSRVKLFNSIILKLMSSDAATYNWLNIIQIEYNWTLWIFNSVVSLLNSGWNYKFVLSI